MKKERLKIFIIAILIILIVIFSVLLSNKNKEVEIQLSLEESNLTEEEIYQEVLTEVLYGEEKYVDHDGNGNRINTSDRMKEKVIISGETGLEVQGIDITSKNDKTIISGIVKNNTTQVLGDNIYKISLKDDTGVEIIEVGVSVDEIAGGEEFEFQTYVTMDLANAYSYSVSK